MTTGFDGCPLKIPTASERDGWAFWGLNFSGPGWRNEFRMRPRNSFDFVSKIHDLGYVINNLSIKVALSGKIDDKYKSKLAKIDRIFKILNEYAGVRGAWLKLLNWGSKQIFKGKDTSEFLVGDGFINPLLNQCVLEQNFNISANLWIPYDHLPNPPKRAGGKPDYFAAVEYDLNPGWEAWARGKYGSAWNEVLRITDQTGPW